MIDRLLRFNRRARRLLAFALLAATFVASPSLLAQEAKAAAPFEKEILAFEAAATTNPPPTGAILFLGSSSIRLWQTLAGDFPDRRVINRGFGGSQISDSIRYAERLIFPCAPKQIVFYAGGNDINGGKTPERVFTDFRTLVETVHARLPATRITYISIAPNPARWAQVERVRAANALIAEYTARNPRLAFINVFPHMLGDDGQPRPEIFVADRLHMNAKGYELWTRLVRPYLEN